MKDVLMILHAREIPEVISSYKALDIPRVWFRGYTEKQLEKVIPKFIEESDFENYLIISDDLIANADSLELVRYYLKYFDVVTGWCEQWPGSKTANITLRPNNVFFKALLMTRYAGRYVPGMSFATCEEIRRKFPIFRTWFVGGALTGLRRKLWLAHPFKTAYNGQGSDMAMSEALEKDGVPMFCARDAFMRHLKSRENWIVGKVERQVILDYR